MAFEALVGNLYDLFYFALYVIVIFFFLGLIGLAVYFYVQATRYDVIAYIKRKGVPSYMKDKIRFIKTKDSGFFAKLVKLNVLIHPEKIKPYLQFVHGKKKPYIVLYTEDLKEFYPVTEQVETIEKIIEVEKDKGKKEQVKVKGAKLIDVVNVDDRMATLYALEELKRMTDRTTLENPFKKFVEVAKVVILVAFVLIAFMLISNTMQDFANKMIQIQQENNKMSKEYLDKALALQNTTRILINSQQEYLRELRRLTESVTTLVDEVRKEQETFREWVEKNSQGGVVNATTS